MTILLRGLPLPSHPDPDASPDEVDAFREVQKTIRQSTIDDMLASRLALIARADAGGLADVDAALLEFGVRPSGGIPAEVADEHRRALQARRTGLEHQLAAVIAELARRAP